MTGLEDARAKRWWLVGRPIGSIERAAAYVDDLGFALLFPKRGITLPSLWDAACARPLRGPDGGWEWGPDAERLWGWKDELPRRKLAWYGPFVRGRPSFLSRQMLTWLYPRSGKPDDFADAGLSKPASRIATVLLRSGPLPKPILKRAVGLEGRKAGADFDKAVNELGRALVVTHFGVEESEAGWPAAILELTARAFRVGRGRDLARAAERYLDVMIEARPPELAKAFGWTTGDAREALDGLVASGKAQRDGSGYRAVPPKRSGSRRQHR